MSEEVKRDLRSEWMSEMSAHTPNYEGWLESLVESTRQALADTKAQLETLEDAIVKCFELVDSDPITYRTKPHNYVIANGTVDPISIAISNSLARKQ